MNDQFVHRAKYYDVNVTDRKEVKHCFTNKSIFLLGGYGCIGKQIYDRLSSCVKSITYTSSKKHRKSVKNNTRFQVYDLLENKFNGFEGHLHNYAEYDILILNAFKTVSKNREIWSSEKKERDDEKNNIDINLWHKLPNSVYSVKNNAWNNDIFQFSPDILSDRIKINLFGYVELVQNIIKSRINSDEVLKPTVLVFMDANESKYAGKMIDGKHLEINMVKLAVKQIFYTSAKLLASLNVITICYDPGWVTYHGNFAFHQGNANTEFYNTFIDSNISVSGLLHYVNDVYNNFQKYIQDFSVYDYINYTMNKYNTLMKYMTDLFTKDVYGIINRYCDNHGKYVNFNESDDDSDNVSNIANRMCVYNSYSSDDESD